MIIIERRYEYMTRQGKNWTNWFDYDKAETIEEAKEKMKKSKEPIKKYKGEYRIKENDK